LGSKFTISGTTITVNHNATYDELYDATKAFKFQVTTTAFETPTVSSLILTANGGNLTAFAGWTLVVSTGVTLTFGSKFNFVNFDTVTLNGTGQITGIYGTSAGVSTVLELRNVAPGASYVAMNNTTKATILFGVNNEVTAQTYPIFFPPGSAGTPVYVARKNYLNQLSYEVITLAPGGMWYTFVDIPDEGITETTLATVQAYTSIETTSKLYDYISAFQLTEAGLKLGAIVNRAGPLLQFGDYSGVVNQSAASVFNITGNTITLKATGLAGTTRYTTIIATPPATWEADTNEVMSIDIEDANGDSSVTISASGNNQFELWKISDATNPDDYATGTLLATVGIGKYRFLSANGFKMVIRDTTTNFRVVSEMEKGTYQAALFFGADVQLAQAPEVSQINTKVDLLQVDLEAIKGTGFVSDADSLVKIRKKAALAAALSA
jgi:hypothetical protein